MPATINDLPSELLSQILETVLRFNVEQEPWNTYNFDMKLHAPRDPDVRMQWLLKDHIPPDSVRWAASNTIRQVNSRWHEVVLKYAFRDLYVVPWRRSDKHLLSGVDRMKAAKNQFFVVSSESSSFLGRTDELLKNHPMLSSYLRSIWFDGYYEAWESDMILRILHRCKNLGELLIPWTVLRHGTVEDCVSLFGSSEAGPYIRSLAILATKLPQRLAAMRKENHFDNRGLLSVSVNFTNVTILRFLGHSNLMSITHKDMIAMARTANNLRELHVSNAASLDSTGIQTLIESSQLTLEVVELYDSSQTETENPEQHTSQSHLRMSRLVARCPLLRRLRLPSIRTCGEIVACDDVAWSGKVQIYIGVNSSFQVPRSDEDTVVFCQVLDQARGLMDSRTRSGKHIVDIEIFISRFVFEPRSALVYGDFSTPHVLRGAWSAQKMESHRVEQMTDDMRAYPFCITEDEFQDGLDKGYVWL